MKHQERGRATKNFYANCFLAFLLISFPIGLPFVIVAVTAGVSKLHAYGKLVDGKLV